MKRQEGGEPDAEEPEHVQGASNRLRLAIAVIIILVVVGVSAAVYLQPTASSGLEIGMVSGRVNEANSASVDLSVQLSLHNTTNKNVTYYGGLYNLSDNAEQIDSGAFHDNVIVAPGQTRVVNESILVDLGDRVSVNNISTQGTWRLQGTATVNIAGTNMTQGFDLNFATT
ncbi:MAG: hypothetical protein OK455_09425 [Thaumarchaeota archaeon]|nr:hypothetical protein [Nitrososphaerota archaeon]